LRNREYRKDVAVRIVRRWTRTAVILLSEVCSRLKSLRREFASLPVARIELRFGSLQFVASLLVFILGVPAAKGQQNPRTNPAQETPRMLDDLLDRIESLPIEYRADLTFTLLKQAPQRISRDRRNRLLNSILADAYTAKYPLPLVYANSKRGTVDSQRALDLVWLPLDRVSIEGTALGLSFDAPSKLWAAFDNVPSPHTRTDCSESLTPDAGPYYRAMVRLFRKGLPGMYPNQRSAEDYLVEAVQRIESPAQLLGFLDAVNTYELDSSRQNDVILALTSRVGILTPLDREMSGAEGANNNLTAALELFITKNRLSKQATAALLQAYRRLLINGLHLEACDDFTLDRAAEASRFNALDTSLIGESPKPVGLLTETDLQATGRGGSAKVELIESDELLRAQTHRLFQLFEANQENKYDPYSDQPPLQPDSADIGDILTAAKEIPQTTDESELSRYENRQALLMTALKLLPSGPSFQDIVDAEVSFLNLNPIEESSPPEWLRALKDLVLMSRPVPMRGDLASRADEQNGKRRIMPTLDAAFIRSTLRRYQSDRIIAAYIAYEDTISPPYEF
jgi:hypothetical protein